MMQPTRFTLVVNLPSAGAAASTYLRSVLRSPTG
jgi:hypothetical protein